MSYRANQFHQRLDRAERKIRPVGSFAYRLANLCDSDREIYYAFREELNRWSDKFQGEELYIHILATVEGVESNMPVLNPRIESQLYPRPKNTDPFLAYEELKESLR